MIKVALHGAEFFAYHGFYPEEQKLGSRFLVDISVKFMPTGNLLDDEIGNTVNYEQLYNIASHEMQHTRKLIETVGQAIANEVKQKFPFVEKISVCIKKMDPPLRGKVGHSNVVVTI